MNHGSRAQVTEPDAEAGQYEAQAGSSATRTEPIRQRESSERDSSQRSTRQQTTEQDGSSGLINDQKLDYFAGRWDSIQGGFVDDPRRTVEQADRLVAEVIDHLSTLFKEERAKLEGQWSSKGEANTEDLRIAMQRYRNFFRTLVGR